MIPTALLLSRYRAFSDEQRLELAPLSVIIGKNGGGKSILTRLPLLLASGLSSKADGPLDLTAGDVLHAARYEDLVYQRSAQPFAIGAEISDGQRVLSFKATLRHVVESHSLALEAFELKEDGREPISLAVIAPEDIGSPSPRYRTESGNHGYPIELVGLFPLSFGGSTEISLRLGEARSQFEKAFSQPSYLGPFRSERGSLPRIPRQGIKSLGARGEQALDVLGDDALRGSGELVRIVENWFEESMNGNRVKLERSGDLTRMVVHDRLRNVDIDIAETGAGFAQVFPVVVQALGLSADRLSSSLVIVEQPELHLHPGAHGAVADLIMQTVTSCYQRSKYICETHSEQIIARIRRRVAEGTIAANAIKIISVGHQGATDSQVEPLRNITLDDLGNPSAWPIGVFDEAFDDLVHLREAARKREATRSEQRQ
jgi:predicted ATPase